MIVSLLIASEAFALEQTITVATGPNKTVKAELIMPEGKGPFPGVLVLHSSGNVDGGDIGFAKQMAREGFACLVPYYFDAYGIGWVSRSTSTTKYAADILADFESEIEYLKTNPGIRAEKVGAVGFSMGGYWSLVLAAKGRVQAGISYYGAISGGGKDLPLTYPFREIFTKDSSPVLILHGSDDSTVPVKQAEMLSKLLDKRKSPYEIKIYEGAEHGYNRGHRSNKNLDRIAKPNTYDAAAANDSWERSIVFFNKYVK